MTDPAPDRDDDDVPDPLALLDNLAPFVESLRGMVALFLAEGFTEQQARALTVKLCTTTTEEDPA